MSFADILFTLIRCSFIESFFFPGKRGKNSLKVIFLVWKLDILFLQVCYKVLSIGPFLWRVSTETALIRLTDQILTNIDNDELTGLVFIDFRKAFDVIYEIDHELLLKNLSMFGVRPSSVTWFKSYLSERKQFITLGKVKSEQLTVKQGVPQGSILGPVLFVLFINDIPFYVHKSTMDIYADDSTLSSSSDWKTFHH